MFLAHDTTLRRKVALKVLGSATEDETARDRLLREARNAAALNHANICTVYESVARKLRRGRWHRLRGHFFPAALDDLFAVDRDVFMEHHTSPG